MPDTLVVIPTRPTDVEKARRTAAVQKRRANVDCTVLVVPDKKKEGWFGVHNRIFKESKERYYVYSCDDYYPGWDYLNIAMFCMLKYGAGLVAFNDGKWHGKISTVGLVDREWVLTLKDYDGNLFYPKYTRYCGDAEIGNLAMREGRYHYAHEAILMEIDYEKDLRASSHKPDDELYRDRGHGKWLEKWLATYPGETSDTTQEAPRKAP